jgi:hypothetical protein
MLTPYCACGKEREKERKREIGFIGKGNTNF